MAEVPSGPRTIPVIVPRAAGGFGPISTTGTPRRQAPLAKRTSAAATQMWEAFTGKTVTITVSASPWPAKQVSGCVGRADGIGQYLPDLVTFHYSAHQNG